MQHGAVAENRSEIARNAAAARWKKGGEKVNSVPSTEQGGGFDFAAKRGCFECGSEMSDLTLGDGRDSMFLLKLFWCRNEKCSRYALAALGGRLEIRNASCEGSLVDRVKDLERQVENLYRERSGDY